MHKFKHIFASLLALIMIFAAAPQAYAAESTFSDVATNHWAYAQIKQAVSDGIVGGYADGTFKPANSVSYGAFSLMLARAFYASELATYSDKGTATGEAIMNSHKILDGTSRKNSSIGAAMPREDMAQAMYNILVDMGATIPAASEYTKAMSKMSDYTSISGNCRTGVLVCYTLGLLNGQTDGGFGPKNSMNRAQACVVIYRLKAYIEDNGGTVNPGQGQTQNPGQEEIPTDKPVDVPTVTDLPEFKLQSGETVQTMMKRVNASTTYTPGYLTNGKPITEENIKEALAEFEEMMPHGTTWDESSTYNYQSPGFGAQIACGAFAAALSDALFDESAPITRHQNFDQLKVGDVVFMRNSATGYNHAFVVTSLTAVGRGPDNYRSCSGNVSGQVTWEGNGKFSTYDKPEVASGTYIYSRY